MRINNLCLSLLCLLTLTSTSFGDYALFWTNASNTEVTSINSLDGSPIEVRLNIRETVTSRITDFGFLGAETRFTLQPATGSVAFDTTSSRGNTDPNGFDLASESRTFGGNEFLLSQADADLQSTGAGFGSSPTGFRLATIVINGLTNGSGVLSVDALNPGSNFNLVLFDDLLLNGALFPINDSIFTGAPTLAYSFTNVAAVPEPTSLALAGIVGISGLTIRRLTRRKKGNASDPA